MSSDPHKGGDLSDMAKDGTSIPNDAGKQRVIPSVPNPHQKAEPDNIVDNPTDIPRNPREPGATGQVLDANTGEKLPAAVEKKQGKTKAGDAQAGHEVVPEPGEEGDDQETIRQRKGA